MHRIFPPPPGLTEKNFRESLKKVDINIELNKVTFGGGCASLEIDIDDAETEENVQKEIDSIKLKPCPYCNNEELELVEYQGQSLFGVVASGGSTYRIKCNKCEALGGPDVSKKGAMNIWNMRAEWYDF